MAPWRQCRRSPRLRVCLLTSVGWDNANAGLMLTNDRVLQQTVLFVGLLFYALPLFAFRVRGSVYEVNKHDDSV